MASNACEMEEQTKKPTEHIDVSNINVIQTRFAVGGCDAEPDGGPTHFLTRTYDIDDQLGAAGGTDITDENLTPPESDNAMADNDPTQKLRRLEELQKQLQTNMDICPMLYDVSLKCLGPNTNELLSYHLDVESEILSSNGCCKDYRGIAHWIGLENVFIRYLERGAQQLKTREVISKWLTREGQPTAIIGNLRKCLLYIERPDVLEDMSVKIALDALNFLRTKYEAQIERPIQQPEDTSWQLTRHDVLNGQKTFYTACLLYADEDELMAELIIKLYKKACKDALFFIPQFDLKMGKMELDTTARVIDERCAKKVVFLLSEYFYASPICQFAVNFAAVSGTGQGNLIPFHLTRNVSSVPNVLKGISGIRWFRKATRQTTWGVLTEALLADKLKKQGQHDMLDNILSEVTKAVESDKEYYTQDPPYEDDVKPPGEPIAVTEPSISSSSHIPENSVPQISEVKNHIPSSQPKLSIFKRVTKVIEKVFNIKSPVHRSTSSATSHQDRGDIKLNTLNKPTSKLSSKIQDSSSDSCLCSMRSFQSQNSATGNLLNTTSSTSETKPLTDSATTQLSSSNSETSFVHSACVCGERGMTSEILYTRPTLHDTSSSCAQSTESRTCVHRCENSRNRAFSNNGNLNSEQTRVKRFVEEQQSEPERQRLLDTKDIIDEVGIEVTEDDTHDDDDISQPY